MRRLGRYEVGEVLGVGGQGAVHRATLVGPGGFRKAVALKVLTSEGASLRREARIGGLLRHQNLVDIYEIGEDGGTWFCAMELCQGGALSHRGPLPPRAVVEVGIAVCRALTYAHEELQLVHRDIKPANLLLSEHAEVKLADLGIAEAAGFDQGAGIRGTPAYMPPEQARGEPVDARADVFALGVTLVELATGQPQRSSQTLDFGVFGEAEGPMEEGPSIPDWLAPAVLPSLNPDPEQRWPDAAALEQALRQLDATGDGLATALGLDDEDTPSLHGWRSHNLPAERGPFVGRKRELSHLCAAMEDCRAIAVTGPAGIGKSRLALEAMHVWKDRPETQVWWCDLAAVRDREGIISAVGEAMRVPLRSEDSAEQVGRMLAGRGPTVLFLDNVEHLLEHVNLVTRWLQAAPELRVLTTTRITREVAGFHAVEVPPLSETEARGLLAALAEQRGASVDADPALPELVRRLDGVPLAVELAAGRLGVLTVDDVLSRLGAGILRSAGQGRHQSLRTALEWSWDMLEPADRVAVTQLTVFAGDFSVEAAEVVLGLPPHSSVLDALGVLVQHSVVRTSGDRFHVLRGMRELAATKADTTAAQARHAEWYARLGTPDALSALRRHGGEEFRSRLVQERENLLAALEYAARNATAECAVQLLAAGWVVLRDTGPFGTGLALASEVLQRADLSDLSRGTADLIAGDAAVLLGRLEEGHGHLQEALGLFGALGDVRGEVDARTRLGELAWRRGALEEAHQWFTDALAGAKRCGADARLARVTGLLGVVCHHMGRLDDALAHEENSVRMFRELGLRSAGAIALGNLATLYHTLSRTEDARQAYETVLILVSELGNRRVEGVTLSNLGNLHLHLGESERALSLYERALRTHRELGNPGAEGRTLGCMGLAVEEESLRREYLESAVRIASETGDERQEGYWLMQLARGARGDRSVEWLERAEAILVRVGDPSMLAMLSATRAEYLHSSGRRAAALEQLALAEKTAPEGDQESTWAIARAKELLGVMDQE